MKIYQKIAGLLKAIENCEKSENQEWQGKHENSLFQIATNFLPSGAGFDSGCTINIDKSNSKKIVIDCPYHCMDDVGYYDGWLYPQAIIPVKMSPEKWQQQRIVKTAKMFIGTKYVHKHIPILGIDCSNFTSFVYNYALGIKFVSHVEHQARLFRDEKIKMKDLKTGDLMFFYDRAKKKVGHVGIYLGRRGKKRYLIDSTKAKFKGVAVRRFKGWYVKRFAWGGRVIKFL